MVIRGGVGWTAHLPSLSRIATLLEPRFGAAASGRPSPLKSAMTSELGEPPVAVVIDVVDRAPFPSPKRTITDPADDRSITTRSSLPSALTSQALADPAPPMAKSRVNWKVLFPLPRSM